MKLLVITAIKEFENDIKLMLKAAAVKSFSYKEVKGYNDNSDHALEDNWFASETHFYESVLFYAFIPKENVDTLFTLVAELNKKQDSNSQIHLASLNIDKSN